MGTRFGFVGKNRISSPQNGDENAARRQKSALLAQKWGRDSASSAKIGFHRLKMATRLRLVGKIVLSSPQNGDKNEARRQKMDFIASKWRRDCGSSSKKCFHRLKMATRMRLVDKKVLSSLKSGDEIRPRRQKTAFPFPNWRRDKEGKSSPLLFSFPHFYHFCNDKICMIVLMTASSSLERVIKFAASFNSGTAFRTAKL